MLEFWSIIVYIICNFFVNAAIIVFLHCFYDSAILWNKKKALLFAVSALVAGALQYFLGESLLDYLLIVANAIVALYDYKGKKIAGILRVLGYSLLLQFFIISHTMFVSICISSSTFDTPVSTANAVKDYLITNAIGAVFFASVFFVLYPQYRKGVVMRGRKREVWIFLVTLFLTIILSTAVDIHREEPRVLRYILALYAMLWAFLFPFFLFSNRVRDYYSKRTVIQEQHMEAELAHFQQYRQTQEATSRFRHDIRNNLLCVSEMLQQGRTQEASCYLNEMLEIVESLSKKYVTGDALLDSILGIKSQVMDGEGIRFELDGVLAGGLPWKPMDICNVFANALDNAIEACQKVKPDMRRISMTIRSTPQFWFVTIENPVAEAVDTAKLFRKNGGYTSKSDSAQHGIGTYNMKYTVESYGDMLKAECSNKTFQLEIMIDKNSPKV